MKILFAYFDFPAESQQAHAFQQLGECELNFDTEYNYNITKEPDIRPGSDYIYKISRHKKPDNESLMANFWGNRIYNITAIVGNNGSGKSTIIHKIIQAIVYGLDPHVPFLLVLKPTDPGNSYIYCSKNTHVRCEEDTVFPIFDEYPEDLLKSKCMLLDNTLSLSSLILDDSYNSFVSYDYPQTESDYVLNPHCEPNTQFYNRSLLSTIRYSNGISKQGIANNTPSIYDIFHSHFCYESFQEIRFLFDRFQMKKLDSLRETHYPLPHPCELIVFTETIPLPDDDRYRLFPESNYLSGVLLHYHFVGEIVIALFNNLKSLLYKEQFLRSYSFPLQKRIQQSVSFADTVSIIKDIIKDICHHTPFHDFSFIAKQSMEKYLLFLDFVINNEKTLSEIFKPYYNQIHHNRYKINYEQTLNNPSKKKCMISFLETYRAVCYPHYFLVFSSGMSSGEKNYLRMLTQFRYMLSGPAVYAEHASEHNTGDRLLNVFDKRVVADKNTFTCDTLFLFLDEADLTYHPEWQRKFVSMLTEVLPIMFQYPYNEHNNQIGCCDIQVIISTHSPLMLGDFPKASVNYLKSKNSNCTVPDSIHQHSTFGENLYTILKEGFFLESPLGMFASNKINKAAKWCTKIRNNDYSLKQIKKLNEEYKMHYQTAQLLAPGIIKNKLLLELNFCADKLDIHDEEIKPATLRQYIADLEVELQKARTKLLEEEQNL